MDDTQVHVTEKPALPGTAATAALSRSDVPSIRKSGIGLLFSRVLKFLASLRLTVVLFALSIILVFCGTLAQVDSGIWTAVDKYFRSFFVWIPFQIFVSASSRRIEVGGGFPFPGGWLLGSLLLVNLLAAHAVRFKFTKKRLGIIVLHAGLIIMMVSELLTGKFAVEGSMLIFQGQSTNYLMHTRETELVIVPEATGETADVTVVPMKLLRRGGLIKDDVLPFDVEVVKYMVNSRLCRQDISPEYLSASDLEELPLVPRGEPNLASAGLAAKLYVAMDLRETGGVEQDKEDLPAAYVRIREKQTNRDLGTFLVGIALERIPQYVTVDAKKYDIRLRRKRTYQPYSVHLIKFSHDVYQGTDIPKNFSSQVRLTDASRGVDREARIYMNNPLFYDGETFYQQGHIGDKGTILQVVRNPAWPMPYLSFFMVAIGLLVHFGLTLVGFLSTRKTTVTAVSVAATATPSFLPGSLAAGAGAVYFLFMMIPPGDGADKMRLTEAAKLPALDGGRVMPLDSIARNSLMTISGGKQTFVDARGATQPAIQWLMDVMSSPKGDGPATYHKVFRIENFQILALLHLEPRSGLRYSLGEIIPRYSEFQREFNSAIDKPQQDRDVFDKNIIHLGQHLRLYQNLNELRTPKLIPPMPGTNDWMTLVDAYQLEMHQKGVSNGGTDFALMLAAYAKQDAKAFSASLENYRKTIQRQLPADASRAEFETFFNHFDPFFQCAVLYVIVLILACLSWITYPVQLRQAAFGLMILTLLVHTFSLFARMYLMDRPLVFVTNLYSSAVFIGWICVILGLVLEWIFRNGLGSFVGAETGFLTLLIGYFLGSSGGDTLEMMRAVLDTNFWLATHVTCVTIGYASTFVAGSLGIAFILRGVFTKTMGKDESRTMGRMIYGIICFALLFSFVGTVLGGLWADYSWGRFWGWDTKENGALLIVIWNALILHARWCGLVQQRGMAMLAVGGNIVTTWSWFGVNMLGVGLHTYASASGFWYMVAFMASQLAIIAISMVPMRLWPGFAVSALLFVVGVPATQEHRAAIASTDIPQSWQQ